MIDQPVNDFGEQIQLRENISLPSSPDWEYQMRREMQEILPGLYLGPYAAAMKTQLENLKQKGITHIICVRQDCESHWIRENMPHLFTYLIINMSDSPTENIIPVFPQFAVYVDGVLSQGGKILVHGNGGISRSAALVASFVMKKYLYSAADSIRFIQSKRFCVFPNEGFRRQLFEYEPILRASMAANMRGIQSFHPKRSINDVDPDDHSDPSHQPPPQPSGF